MDNGRGETLNYFLINIIIILIILLVLLTGCALTPPIDVKKQSEETYRKDMSVVVDGEKYTGIAVLPVRNLYKFTLYPKEKASRYIIQSCSRDLVIDKPKQGWFKPEYSFVYDPVPDLETGKVCNLEIAALNENTRNSFFFAEFDDTREEVSLQGMLKCNGKFEMSRAGVTLCQSAEGLEQQIFFREKVMIGNIPEYCDEPKTDDNIFWSFRPNRNKCVYYFVAHSKAKNGKRLTHRLTTIGYSSVPYPME